MENQCNGKSELPVKHMGVHIMGILSHNKKITRLEGEGGRKWKEEYWPRTKEFNLIFPGL